MDLKKKQFGLIVKKKTEETQKRIPLSVFGDDDDEADKVDVSYQRTSASTIRVQNQAKRIHDEVLAADPTAFDYDASYDQIQEERDEKISERKAADKERKSKYAENIMKAHKRRELEKHSREERQQQKEREKEGELYADKEVFITGAYREQQEMVEKFRLEEAEEARFNSLTSVEKQKVWQAGLARNLLEDIARTGEPTAKKKERNLRKRMDSRSPTPEPTSSSTTPAEPKAREKKVIEDDKTKRSIYSDDEDGPKFNPPSKKNFEGELKPGLNKVVKAQTKAERLKERQFTPTPPSSDDESDRKHDSRDNRRQVTSSRERREEREAQERQEAEEARKAAKEKEKKNKMKLRIVTAEDKAARLVRLKDLLKQRNGPEEIEEFRRRYLERKESGIVVPPL